MKIIYIHGLGSSGVTDTVGSLRDLIPQSQVIAPDVPMDPIEALKLLKDIARKENPDLIIGTSMGAMYAQQIRGFKKILVNPAFHVSEIMLQNIGTQQFYNPRADGIQEFDITPSLCNDYKDMESRQFDDINLYDIANTYGMFATRDDLVQGHDEYYQYYKNAKWFEGEHRMNFDVIKNDIVPLINDIL